MSNVLDGQANSQAEIDRRSRETRRHLENIEARLVSDIRTTHWWSGLRLPRLVARIYRSPARVADHSARN